MLDEPSADMILDEVRSALNVGIAPGFQQRVAANAIALVQREQAGAMGADEAERARLTALLGRVGTLEELNAALAGAIASGALVHDDAALRRHLVLTVIATMEIDQPHYPAFRALREEGAA